MTTLIKTSKDIATSLSGSAFRRICADGRTRLLRAIPTWGGRGRTEKTESSSPKGGLGPPRPL
jgi:hypothetical protein